MTKTGRVASIDEDTAFIQSDLNHLTNYFNTSRGRMKFISVLSQGVVLLFVGSLGSEN